MIKKHLVALFVIVSISGCAIFNPYSARVEENRKKRQEESKILLNLEQEYRSQNCSNLKFRFESSLSFSKQEAVASLKCIDIYYQISESRRLSTGVIQLADLAFAKGYETNRAIFYHLSTGELPLNKARDLYIYTMRKSEIDARYEMEQSNALLMQGLRNQQIEMEQENRRRADFLKSLEIKTPPPQPIEIPRHTTTKCTPELFGGMTCETR